MHIMKLTNYKLGKELFPFVGFSFCNFDQNHKKYFLFSEQNFFFFLNDEQFANWPTEEVLSSGILGICIMINNIPSAGQPVEHR